MKRLYPVLAFTCALLPLPGAMAQTTLTSSTPVIGFYKFDVPVGTSIWTCGLVTKKAFQGQASSMTSGTNSTLTMNGAAWPTFGLHYVEILSGAQSGLVLDILSNTATTLQLKGNTASLGLSGTESFCVRSHSTLGSVFQGGAGLNGGTDTVTLVRDTGRKTYAWNGSGWEDGDLNDAGNTIIYPGQAFLINNGKGSPSTVTFGGGEVAYVKSGPIKVPLYRGIPNLVGLVNPLVSTTIGDSNFASSNNLLGNFGLVSSLSAGNDTVALRQNNGSLTPAGVYQSNGSNLEDGELNDGSNVQVRNGVGLIISVQADRTWTVPSLLPAGQ